jgi:hypothetical protein
MLIFDIGPIIVDTEMQHVKGEKWYSTDRYINYMKNAKRSLWVDEEIVYNFNKHGYRTKDIEDLNTENFMLTFGCSYTEGVGLHETQIWNHYLKNELNLDLYNLAKQGTGMDIQAYNSMRWVETELPLPKLVVIQWPNKARKSFASHEEDGIALIDKSDSKSHDNEWWKKRYIIDTSEMDLNALVWFELANFAWKSVGVPVLNFTWDNDLPLALSYSKFKIKYVEPSMHDKARDGIHDGPVIHKETADILLDLIESGNFTDKV